MWQLFIEFIKITKKAEVWDLCFFYHVILYGFLTFTSTYFFTSVSSFFRFGSFLANKMILYT